MIVAEQQERYTRLLDLLQGMKRVLVAFSGGVDSTLLLYVAKQVLPDDVLAVTFSTPYTPAEEVDAAAKTAAGLGVEHRIVKLPMPEVLRENPPDRCYVCKRLLFGQLLEIAAEKGIDHVVDGSNVDDLADYRPGRRAVEELGIQSPLLAAGMTKQDIRDLSRQFGLSTWNRPAGACLLTRIPHNTHVDETELSRIDAAERYLRSLGFGAVRVRSHGNIARIEVPYEMLTAVIEANSAHGIQARFKELGYMYVTLDLGGYRMGSLNPDSNEQGSKKHG